MIEIGDEKRASDGGKGGEVMTQERKGREGRRGEGMR